MSNTNTEKALIIDPIEMTTMHVPIIGVTPLITHAWSEKAKRKMLDERMGREIPKELKDPEAEYEASMYRTKDGGYGFPSAGFKSAMVSATRLYGKKVTMTALRQILYVHGTIHETGGQSLVDIEGTPHMREDMVRIGRGTDLRYRAEFSEWSAILRISFAANSIAESSVLSLLQAGGQGVGVGDWRPERNGEHGIFMVDTDRGLTTSTLTAT